ncbi:LysR family transcriptional regulator [Vreelandella songnenensis]|uniref:LysR family transcriptional regulator n=1 Tax=Vreelandella songnenensis TaxID=1176243 RepID=A0A2T0V4V9_9GAMM|nr:LysR family transcriptional regulator [Halomonas songnenensis]PRY65212.1 LysR family transcriptional regulator [Halomonas songnenensis]
MDRFHAMQAFARVVETGSFTKAAETLHISKTSVTQLVQQLEARLRVKLLNRTTRKVNATADGAAYYERVIRLLADMDDAETSLSHASATPRGRLRIDVPSPFARMILIPALPAFYAQYPDIHIDMGVSDRLVDLIDENVDCVVRGGELTDLSLMARRVGELSLGIYAAPGYLQTVGVPEHPNVLSSPPHYTVGFKWRAGLAYAYTLHGESESVSVQGRCRITVDDGNAALAAGLAGLGAVSLPEYMAREHVSRGELVRLFDGWHLDPMPLFIAFPPNRHVSAKLRAFIDWVVMLMEEPLPGTLAE